MELQGLEVVCSCLVTFSAVLFTQGLVLMAMLLIELNFFVEKEGNLFCVCFEEECSGLYLVEFGSCCLDSAFQEMSQTIAP